MKNSLLACFVFCAISLAAFEVETAAIVVQEGERAGIYYRDGARYALEGRLEEARAAFEQSISLDPKNGNAYYSLGNIYAELGRWDDAIASYRRALSFNKKDVEAYNGLGIALGRQQLYGQAVEAFERAIDIYPKWAEPHYHLSQVYGKLGQDVAAQVAYNQAIRLRPDYATLPPRTLVTTTTVAADVTRDKNISINTPTPRNTTTDVRAATDNGRSAAENVPPARTVIAPKVAATPVNGAPRGVEGSGAARKAAGLNTGDSRAYLDLGTQHGRAGRHEDAVAAFRQAVILDRNNGEAYVALGNSYAELGRWRESVDAYEQAVRLNPKDGAAYERLGRSYAKLRESTPLTTAGGAAVGARTGAPAGASAETNEMRERNANAALSRDAVREAATDARTERNTAPAGRVNAPDNAAGSTTRSTAGTTTARNPAEATPAGAASAGGVDLTALYRVGAGDVLDIRVPSGRTPRETAHKVTSAGLLDYPLLTEPLRVVGLTTDEIAAQLGAELKRRAVVPNAEVSVGVREYASHAIIISGMVKDPGTKVLRREGVPLYVIVAHAQPLPEAGRVVVVSHATGQSSTFDLGDTRSMDMLVRSGDVITVQAQPRQYFYIAGAVREPGQKEFHEGLTLTQAVLAAGGAISPNAQIITVARQGSNGRLVSNRYNLREISAGGSPDPSIRQGDRIEVLR